MKKDVVVSKEVEGFVLDDAGQGLRNRWRQWSDLYRV